VVEAVSADVADRVAQAAERNLKDLGRQWLGRELPDWTDPCPITVTLGTDGSRGHSTFTFQDGRVLRQEVFVEGSLERILDGVLPHEMTHVVLMQHFGRQVPRWADEGGAMLGEGEWQTTRFRDQMQKLLRTPERCIPLQELFGLDRYPHDAHAFYETGFSVSNYLVELKGRRKFLEFVTLGMQDDWNAAARNCYGFDNVDDLERAWRISLRKEPTTRKAAPARHAEFAPPPRLKLGRSEQAGAK
jgi:hypothetical protein